MVGCYEVGSLRSRREESGAREACRCAPRLSKLPTSGDGRDEDSRTRIAPGVRDDSEKTWAAAIASRALDEGHRCPLRSPGRLSGPSRRRHPERERYRDQPRARDSLVDRSTRELGRGPHRLPVGGRAADDPHRTVAQSRGSLRPLATVFPGSRHFRCTLHGCGGDAVPNRKSSRRELIDTGSDKRYVRRDEKGHFKESDDQGRSLPNDRRRDARTKSERGQGDRGDR